MKDYPVKLAQNNSDETHWSYKRFVKPGTDGFKVLTGSTASARSVPL